MRVLILILLLAAFGCKKESVEGVVYGKGVLVPAHGFAPERCEIPVLLDGVIVTATAQTALCGSDYTGFRVTLDTGFGTFVCSITPPNTRTRDGDDDA